MCGDPTCPACSYRGDDASPTLLRRGRPNRPGVLWWGKTTPCVFPLRVHDSVCYPVLQSAAVACVGNPALSGGNA
eukprot:1437017-Prymnesium_polylepis.1